MRKNYDTAGMYATGELVSIIERNRSKDLDAILEKIQSTRAKRIEEEIRKISELIAQKEQEMRRIDEQYSDVAFSIQMPTEVLRREMVIGAEIGDLYRKLIAPKENK